MQPSHARQLGAQGQETRESALAYLEDQGVAAPVRMARLIAPGFSRPYLAINRVAPELAAAMVIGS